MKTVAVSGKALPSPGTLKNRVNTLVSTEVTTIYSVKISPITNSNKGSTGTKNPGFTNLRSLVSMTCYPSTLSFSEECFSHA